MLGFLRQMQQQQQLRAWWGPLSGWMSGLRPLHPPTGGGAGAAAGEVGGPLAVGNKRGNVGELRGEGQPSRLPPLQQEEVPWRQEQEGETEQRQRPNLDALAPLLPGLIARPWSELRGGNKGGEDCAICLEALGCSVEGGPLVVRLSCCHSYCEVCLRAYIRVMGGAGAAMACPQCRGAIG